MLSKAAYEMICKHRKELTYEELLQMDLAEEDGLKKTQRSYGLMNRDHWTMLLGTDPQSIKTKKVLDILKTERKNVKTDIKIATSYYKVKTDMEVFERMKELINENTELEKQIKQKKKEIWETEDTIRKVQKGVYKLRFSQLTDEALTRKDVEGQRTVVTLENKLDVQVQKFGNIMKDNLKLRDEIDHLLNERKSFKVLWERSIVKLSKGKKVMMDLIEQATIAYDHRDECIATLNALRTKSYQDLMTDSEEMRELERTIDHQSKLSNFLETKEQKRIMIGIQAHLDRKMKIKKYQMENDLQRFRETLSLIQDHFGSSETEDIATKFLKIEYENLTSLKLILQNNEEIEYLGADLREILAQIQEQQKLNELRAIQQPTNTAKFEERLEEATNKADEADQQLQELENKLQQIYEGVWRMFTKINGDITPFMALLGDNTKIHRYNVLLFIDAVQSRIYDQVLGAIYQQRLMKIKAKQTKTKDNKKIAVVVREEKFFPIMKTVYEYIDQNPCPLCVEQEMVSDVIDTLQFARTKEEVKVHLAERLALPDGAFSLHSVSLCHLPKSREIIQKRYQ